MKRLVEVRVLLTEAEFRKLKISPALTQTGTCSDEIRAKLGLRPAPVGYQHEHERISGEAYANELVQQALSKRLAEVQERQP